MCATPHVFRRSQISTDKKIIRKTLYWLEPSSSRNLYVTRTAQKCCSWLLVTNSRQLTLWRFDSFIISWKTPPCLYPMLLTNSAETFSDCVVYRNVIISSAYAKGVAIVLASFHAFHHCLRSIRTASFLQHSYAAKSRRHAAKSGSNAVSARILGAFPELHRWVTPHVFRRAISQRTKKSVKYF